MNILSAVTDVGLVEQFWGRVHNSPPAICTMKILVSFFKVGRQLPTIRRLLAEGKLGSVFLDSGTYSLNRCGRNPGVTELYLSYKEFVKRYGDGFDHVASFDDRFEDPVHNQENYHDLREEVVGVVDSRGRSLVDKIVPVVHARQAADEFRLYAEMGAKMIGIGSTPMMPDDQWREICAIRSHFGVKVHRFGNVGFADLVRYRLDSADSTRYAQATIHGRAMWYWDDVSCMPVKVDLNKRVRDVHKTFLHNTFGWTVTDLQGDVHKIWVVNIYAQQMTQQYLTDVVGL